MNLCTRDGCLQVRIVTTVRNVNSFVMFSFFAAISSRGREVVPLKIVRCLRRPFVRHEEVRILVYACVVSSSHARRTCDKRKHSGTTVFDKNEKKIL